MSVRALKILLDDCQDSSILVFGHWWRSEEDGDEDAKARSRTVAAATSGLDDPKAAELIDAAAVALLCDRASGGGSWTQTPFFTALRRHVLGRWRELAPSLGKALCMRPYTHPELILFPELASERALIAQLALSLASGRQTPYLDLLRAIEPKTLDDARLLLQASLASKPPTLVVLFSRLGLNQGWNCWIKLFAALVVEKRLAQPRLPYSSSTRAIRPENGLGTSIVTLIATCWQRLGVQTATMASRFDDPHSAGEITAEME